MTSNIVILVLVAMATVVHSKPQKIFDKDDQPAFSCPADEQYYTCSQIQCYKTCKDLINPPPCPSVTPDCYKPACECKEDNLRNDKGVCIPTAQCNKSSN